MAFKSPSVEKYKYFECFKGTGLNAPKQCAISVLIQFVETYNYNL